MRLGQDRLRQPEQQSHTQQITENGWDFCCTLGVVCWALWSQSSGLRPKKLAIYFEEPWSGEIIWVDSLSVFHGICLFPRSVSSCSPLSTASHGDTDTPSSYLCPYSVADSGRGKLGRAGLLQLTRKSRRYLGKQADGATTAAAIRLLIMESIPHRQALREEKRGQKSREPVPGGSTRKRMKVHSFLL